MIEVALATPNAVRADVELLLCEADDEFFPRLSSRRDTLSLRQQVPGGGGPSLIAYLNELSRETWLVARDDDALVGLLSFIPDHSAPPLDKYSPSFYVTTIVVSPRVRRTGIGRQLYGALQGLGVRGGARYLTTRTWIGNDSHIDLLAKIGFMEVARVRDDRAPGVDTLYFARPARLSFALSGSFTP